MNSAGPQRHHVRAMKINLAGWFIAGLLLLAGLAVTAIDWRGDASAPNNIAPFLIYAVMAVWALGVADGFRLGRFREMHQTIWRHQSPVRYWTRAVFHFLLLTIFALGYGYLELSGFSWTELVAERIAVGAG